MTGSFAYLSNGVLTLGNVSLQRRFAAAPGQPFITTTFTNRLTGRDYFRLPQPATAKVFVLTLVR